MIEQNNYSAKRTNRLQQKMQQESKILYHCGSNNDFQNIESRLRYSPIAELISVKIRHNCENEYLTEVEEYPSTEDISFKYFKVINSLT